MIALHDIGWPYGRRDLYYAPEQIPDDKRRPFARRAIHPDHDELVEEGINGHLANAEQPAAEHSGVLGAIEDFIAESDLEWTLFEILGEHGLGVLAPAEVLEERGKAADLLESTGEPKFLRRRLEAVERARIDTEIRRVRARMLARRQAGRDVPHGGESDELAAARRQLALARDELDDAERRQARVKRQRDAADEREQDLEEELIAERRKLRRAADQVDEAEDGHRRATARVVELEEDLDALRGDVAAKGRLVADFEESREALERTIDDLRGQADAGMHAVGEMREMLEERELEIQRLDAQAIKLRTTLGRARADAEIAESERSALERRLEDLAARYERALDELAANLAAMLEPPRPGRRPGRGCRRTGRTRSRLAPRLPLS